MPTRSSNRSGFSAQGIAGTSAVSLALLVTLAPVLYFLTDTFAYTRRSGDSRTILDSVAQALVSATLFSSLRFSLTQALLSSLLALALGIPGAYFVAKYRFKGRKLLLSLAAVPFSLPPILVILAFVLYFGKSGWFTIAIDALEIFPWQSSGFLYSLSGLITIHAFYNFPIIVQNVGTVWANLPKSREEAARTLGASKLRAFVVGTLPYLAPSIFQATSIVFLFCFFSFTVVLVFGGISGSTLEVGIYRALKFSGDKPLAVAMGLVQTAIAGLIVFILSFFERRHGERSRDFGRIPAMKTPGLIAKLMLAIYFAGIIVFFFGPLASLVVEAFTVRGSLASKGVFGFRNFVLLFSKGNSGLMRAIGMSLAVSGPAAIFSTMAALLFHFGSRIGLKQRHVDHGSGFVRIAATLPLAISPAIIAAGWSRIVDSGNLAVVLLGQIAIAWPFVARFLIAPFDSIPPRLTEVARTMGSTPFDAFLRVEIALLLPSIASATAFAFAITLGDANIPLIAGGGSVETLPLLIYRLTSSYRFSEACAAGVVLALLAGLAFYAKERIDGLSRT